MADNFNLRTFLTENKLTKNAQLLKEQASQRQEVYYDDGLFEIQAKYPNVETAIQGVKEYLDGGNGVVTFDTWEKAEVSHLGFDGPCYFLVGPDEEPGQQPPLLVSVRDEDLITDPEIVAQYKAEDAARDNDGQEEDLDEASYSDSYDTPAAKKVHGQLADIVDIFQKSRDEEAQDLNAAIDAAEQETGTQVTPTERRVLQQQASWIRTHRSEMEREGVEEGVDEAKEYSFTLTYNDPKYVQKVLDDAGVDAFAKAGTFDDEIIIRAFNAMGLRRAKQALEADHFDIDESIEEAAPSAGMTAKEKSAVVKKAKHGGDIGHKGAGFAKVEKAAEKKYGSKEAGQKVAAAAMWKAQAAKHESVNENEMTNREKTLVEMVNNAMGYTNNDEDQEFDPGHDIEQAQHNIERQYEGEDGGEMADETVIPEYHSIDELMKEIDLGTTKIAEEHKIKKMKAIAEALRAKVKSLEEGEHAKHIDQKAVKQMGKDIAALEKTAAKLQNVFDKKFNKKEKPAAAPKAEKEPVALAEGTFDLRKFLAENRK